MLRVRAPLERPTSSASECKGIEMGGRGAAKGQAREMRLALGRVRPLSRARSAPLGGSLPNPSRERPESFAAHDSWGGPHGLGGSDGTEVRPPGTSAAVGLGSPAIRPVGLYLVPDERPHERKVVKLFAV